MSAVPSDLLLAYCLIQLGETLKACADPLRDPEVTLWEERAARAVEGRLDRPDIVEQAVAAGRRWLISREVMAVLGLSRLRVDALLNQQQRLVAGHDPIRRIRQFEPGPVWAEYQYRRAVGARLKRGGGGLNPPSSRKRVAKS